MRLRREVLIVLHSSSFNQLSASVMAFVLSLIWTAWRSWAAILNRYMCPRFSTLTKSWTCRFKSTGLCWTCVESMKPALFKQPFNCYSRVTLRQVPVPVKQQKHIEARCAAVRSTLEIAASGLSSDRSYWILMSFIVLGFCGHLPSQKTVKGPSSGIRGPSHRDPCGQARAWIVITSY